MHIIRQTTEELVILCRPTESRQSGKSDSNQQRAEAVTHDSESRGRRWAAEQSPRDTWQVMAEQDENYDQSDNYLGPSNAIPVEMVARHGTNSTRPAKRPEERPKRLGLVSGTQRREVDTR